MIYVSGLGLPCNLNAKMKGYLARHNKIPVKIPQSGTMVTQFQLVHRKHAKIICLPIPVLGNEIHYPQFSESLQKLCEREHDN